MVSVLYGINNDDIGPIAKASFEETPEMFLWAARLYRTRFDDVCQILCVGKMIFWHRFFSSFVRY